MSEEYFAGILGYKSAMAQARLMLSKGIISEDEYAIIDTMMAEKYGLSSCSLFRENDLLYSDTRGNMSHYEEVTKCQYQQRLGRLELLHLSFAGQSLLPREKDTRSHPKSRMRRGTRHWRLQFDAFRRAD